MSAKERLDVLLVKRGLAESRDWAQRLIRAGQVRVDGQVVAQPAKRFGSEAKKKNRRKQNIKKKETK
jgi:23S rRNA (cytidine1920-2'-O)/16S rRNA (cytidine1409-2'-O)-methyltransferase